jgi:uncharacterized membrane protein
MPFCSQCGNQVTPIDAFCGRCGARQPLGQTGFVAGRDPFAGITPRTASVLCYVPGLGWIASIIVLASQRFRRDRTVRFHAFQGLYLFVAWLMNEMVVRPIFEGMTPTLHLHSLVAAVLVVASIFMMVKASQDEAYSLPLFGELAERSVTEG